MKDKPDVFFIILFQKRPVNDAEDVLPVGIPVVSHCPVDDFFNQVRERPGISHFKAVCQCMGNCQFVLSPELEQVGIPGIFAAPCVRYIEHILQFRVVAGGVNEGNARILAPDIAAHLLIPGVVVSTGGGVGPLGKNHELFMVGVFVQPCHCLQKGSPVLIAAGDLDGGLVC